MDDRKVLEVDNLTIEAGGSGTGKVLVRGVSLCLEPGGVLGLIGESGCGKSLTCLSILGLLPAGLRRTAGEIRIEGRDTRQLSERAMRRLRGRSVAVILQNPMDCFDPVFTIRHHLKETLASHVPDRSGEYMQRALSALREAGFEDPGEILELYPFQLSGGMLQRVMVALALTFEPPLLIADEPTTDLDVVAQAKVLDLLDYMRTKYNTAILLITHDLSVVARMAERVAVMREGRIVETESVKRIFHEPRNPYTQTLLDSHLSLCGPEASRPVAAEVPASA